MLEGSMLTLLLVLGPLLPDLLWYSKATQQSPVTMNEAQLSCFPCHESL